MMCAYSKKPYENLMYKEYSAYVADKEIYKKINPYFNLPSIIDNDQVICQSNACFLYLGKKLGLDGEGSDTQLKIVQVAMQVTDLRNTFVNMSYPHLKVSRTKEEFDANVEKYLDSGLQIHYQKFEEWLDLYKTKFFCGDSVTSPDFHVFEMIDEHELLFKFVGKKTILKKFPKLANFYDEFKKLPELEEYFESDLYKLPCNAKIAHFF